MASGEFKRAYMGGVDFDYDIDAIDGARIYSSLKHLKENQPCCAKSCGMVEVEIRITRVVKKKVRSMDTETKRLLSEFRSKAPELQRKAAAYIDAGRKAMSKPHRVFTIGGPNCQCQRED